MHTANQFKKGLTPASPPAAAAPRVVAGPPPVRTPTPAPRGTPSGQRATAQRSQPLRVASKDVTTISAAEQFSAELMQAEAGLAGGSGDGGQLQETMVALQEQIADLTRQIDALYDGAFSSSLPRLASEWASSPSASESEQQQQQQPDASLLQCPLTEAKFGELGRVAPPLMRALVSGKEKGDPAGWLAFQTSVHSLKLQRSRLEAQLADVTSLLTSAAREAAKQDAELMRQSEEPQAGGSSAAAAAASAGKRTINIVLISGFESFNVALYKQVATQLRNSLGFVRLSVFSDRDIASRPADVAAALDSADAFFGSLLFDFDQVEWLRARTERIPIRLVFESALELMSTTQLGSFNMAQAPGGGGQKAGPPPVVKKVLSMFGSQREEDRMVGYLSFLKLGPKLLQWVPGQKAQDLKHWLTIYSYWNQGGLSNVSQMFAYLTDKFLQPTGLPPKPVVETPAVGCLHPDYAGDGYFKSPRDYMRWYEKSGPLRGTGAPVVAVLLYRKHVITEQQYIPQLIRELEAQGLLPLPVFINGVEAHTVVRDLLTTEAEQDMVKRGLIGTNQTLKPDAVKVDAVVSTIGFPLVGGPAGSMEGGRQAEVAKAILGAKNVPYVVAAPLLIQDLESWTKAGVAGLQSVVLYSLPELDGAIDTVPLGGLVGDNIFLIPERVKRMAARVAKWVALRRKPPSQRKVAVLLYGFPPGVGATGTAALLNVPKSLEALLARLQAEGYDLGGLVPSSGGGGDKLSGAGEALVTALKAQEDPRVVAKGAAAITALGAGEAAAFGLEATAAEVTPAELKQMLTYPPEWGPSEWGPIPFLPEHDVLVSRLEKQWGELRGYRGLSTTSSGGLLVNGLRAGNVFIGVQPLLGVEGDPMRLLFERDLTPHPQYAAFYKWLQHVHQADVVLHFGMHGTVEWLPGSPLGNTGFSWSDVLLGDLPNVYVYACNNPSESIVAKRRGYGTIVSHNVPPYGRAGLYKQMAELKALLAEYRENPRGSTQLKGPIIQAVNQAGLQEDCPWGEEEEGVAGRSGSTAAASTSGSSNSAAAAAGGGGSKQRRQLSPEDADGLDDDAFSAYASRLYQYLQVVENRLFSEGLHVLGSPPGRGQLAQYLSAYFGPDLPLQAVEVVAELGGEGLEVVRSQLERAWRQPAATSPPSSAAPASPSASFSASTPAPPSAAALQDKLAEAVRIRELLCRNTEELDAVVAALNGEYVLPEAGGDLLRDGAGVLPTGRNIHALDPYRMPSPAAFERGTAAAAAILDAHRAANDGAYPETVAVNLWGLDAIKTKGESVAIALHMVGARPVKEGTGRIARFELIPLAELGRPRVDVLCNMSGIFRDSFQNVVELLDDLFQRAAAAADEPESMNYVKKHANAMKSKGIGNPAARLFSNPAGDYGSMVNERVGTSDWDSGAELGETWASRNAFSYGRGAGERGTARPEVLQALLSTTERVIQEVDSVEYGLTDIQEYYANTGALKRAAETARGGKAVGCSIVEAFGKEVKPRELEEVLRLEYRSKLLNPKWAEAMSNQGSGGAFEISQRMTAAVGWGATASFAEDWVWSQAAETYALDEAMAAKLRSSNPQAFSNILKRMLEAAGRGLWNADADVLAKLKGMYAEMDDVLEGVSK